MQKTTGTLSPGGHPGSYNGQDAYNDMLVVEDGSRYHNESQRLSHESELGYRGCDPDNRLQRPTNSSKDRGGTNHMGYVRRLTPLECERLQGFPDNWTEIGDWTDSKGKVHKAADSPRYKAMGNSIALPFWEWMAKRMVQYIPGQATMGSLFSGIGGFELVFQRAGAIPVWNSEIDEFCIAVTKERFKEVDNERTGQRL